MDINTYSLYAKNTQNEMLNLNEHDKVLELLKTFDKIYDMDSAKKQLEKIWNIKDNVQNYSLGGNCFVNASEKNNGFSIRFKLNDENVIYFYKN